MITENQNMRTWIVVLMTGMIIGVLLSASNFMFASACENNELGICVVYPIIRFVSYFPIVYIILYNTSEFVEDNMIIAALYYIIPVLQYTIYGSALGLFIIKLRNMRKNGEKKA